MRESRKGEKTHLPRDSTEVWLGAQKAAASGAKHRSPPEDTYEAWVERRAETGGSAATRGRKPLEVPV